MFTLASSLTAKNLRFFKVMIFLLLFDGAWCLLSYFFGDSMTGLGWAYQNMICLFLIIIIIFVLLQARGVARINYIAAKWLRAEVIILKTVWDYFWYWNTFYFAP